MKKKKIVLIILIILIVVSTVSLIFYIKNQNEIYKQTRAWSNGEKEPQAYNSIFESYFGTEVERYEVRNLLSEIKTNNLTAARNEEPEIIGVCLIINDVNTDEMNGIYQKNQSEIDTSNIENISFENYNFSPVPPDKEFIEKYLKSEKTYRVNVPNNKFWKIKQNSKTGFEKDGEPFGQTQTGETGGYYSSGYIRLIYIIEN